MIDQIVTDTEIEALLLPETDLEQQLINVPKFRKGLLWGLPRYGHPEGQIVKHIRDVYQNIEKLQTDTDTRRKLRLIALIHDTFKYAEHRGKPRDWSRSHGVLGRQFAEKHLKEKTLLEIIELHDEAYFIWRLFVLYNKKEKGQERLDYLLNRLDQDLELYFLFFKCDTQTGDKTQAPLIWFEKIVKTVENSNS